jgi:pimeloyl-ACP methyl ester carboxylesterase
VSVGDATSARRLEVGGIGLNVLDDGEGPAVLLLHGFPDSLDLWRHQVPALTGSGFRVVAPDLRGFGQSDAPEEMEAYALPAVLEDVVGILDQLEVPSLRVVGHDWGAALAWGLAALHPERVERLVAISVGHPATFPGSMEQRALSWYMLFFQFPEAEEALRRDDWRFFREAFGGGGDLDRYIEDLSRPGRLTAGLNWYRANISPESFVSAISSAVPAVSCPTLGVWSSGDVALTEHQMTSSAANVNGPWRYERIDDASHWIPVDAPERLNELLIDFLTGEESR